VLRASTGTYLVLEDSDVLELATMAEIVATIERCFEAKIGGRLIAPPRHSVDFDDGALVFTIGGLMRHGRWPGIAGFRAYETFAGTPVDRSQVVAVWNFPSGRLEGLILGELLGALRTGAIGAVAVKYMAVPNATSCGIVGSGKQAETQLMAVAAVLPCLQVVRVFSRNRQNRDRFALRMSEKLRLPITPSESTKEVVTDADLVLCATDSDIPVLETAWLKPGAHVNSIGPKLVGQHELPIDIGERATVIATDSPIQVHSSDKAFFLYGTPAWDRMTDLAEIVSGRISGRNSNADLTLFCSVGLAGTEVAIASVILARARARGSIT